MPPDAAIERCPVYLHKGVEDIELLFSRAALRFIGTGEVTNNVHRLADIFTLAQTLIKRLGLFRQYAQTVHSGIELHPDGDRLFKFSVFEGDKLLFIVDCGMQMFSGDRRQIVCFKKTFQ